MRTQWVLAAGGLALLTACVSVPHPTPDDASREAVRRPGTTVASLESDRRRYVMKCSSCHMLRHPAKHSGEQWEHYLDKMGDRAKLTPDDREAILRYLTAIAARPAI